MVLTTLELTGSPALTCSSEPPPGKPPVPPVPHPKPKPSPDAAPINDRGLEAHGTPPQSMSSPSLLLLHDALAGGHEPPPVPTTPPPDSPKNQDTGLVLYLLGLGSVEMADLAGKSFADSAGKHEPPPVPRTPLSLPKGKSAQCAVDVSLSLVLGLGTRFNCSDPSHKHEPPPVPHTPPPPPPKDGITPYTDSNPGKHEPPPVPHTPPPPPPPKGKAVIEANLLVALATVALFENILQLALTAGLHESSFSALGRIVSGVSVVPAVA